MQKRGKLIMLTVLLILCVITVTAEEMCSGDYTYVIVNNQATIVKYNGEGWEVQIPDKLSGVPVKTIGPKAFEGNQSTRIIHIPDSVETITEGVFISYDWPRYFATSEYVFSVTDGKVAMMNSEGFQTDVRFPSTIFDMPVTRIGDGTVWLRKLDVTPVSSIIIPQGVETISKHAFFQYAENLSSVTLPASVTVIDDDAFDGTRKLKKIEVDEANEVYAIFNGVLYNKVEKKLHTYPSCLPGSTFTVPEGILRIGDNAFSLNEILETVVLPESIEELGERSFASIKNLRQINLPDSLTNFPPNVFVGSSNIEIIEVSDNHPWLRVIDDVLYSMEDKALLFYPPAKPKTAFAIPQGITKIGEHAFANTQLLKELCIPESVTRIGSYAFASSGITTLTIPDSVIRIGNSAFMSAKIKTVNLPNSLTIIPSALFYGSSLESIEIPATVTEIYNQAFYNCTNLTDIEIPDSVQSIGKYAFNNCQNLCSVALPGTLEFIDEGAFADCPNLTVYTTGSGYVVEYLKNNGIPYKLDKPDWL